jgi:hypothetical protein
MTVWVVGLISSVLCAQNSSKPETSPKSPEEAGSVPVFTGGTQLVLVDVLALDPKSGLPINTLHRDDFRLSDNGHVVSLSAFDSGASYDTRPVALWLVVICNLPGHGPHSTFASGSFADNESLLRPALDDLV